MTAVPEHALPALGEKALIVLVQVTNGLGSRAHKEYDVSTIIAALEAAKYELRSYPNLWVTSLWATDFLTSSGGDMSSDSTVKRQCAGSYSVRAARCRIADSTSSVCCNG